MEHPENSKEYKGMKVNGGIKNLPSVNPYMTYRRSNRRFSSDYYVAGIRSGDISILGQAITLVESSLNEDQLVAQRVIEQCLPYAGRSIRIGITGVPGAGKSTFIETFGLMLCEKGKRLAVLAIDPSSERSKGSILGDKTRMNELSSCATAFIRPSPSGGSLGGVARKTRETIILCEAAGFDTVIVETVGVGQSEVAAQSMVDYFLLLQVTGTGDDLQGIKRGIMEMVSGIAINKCDGNNVEKAQMTQRNLKNALMLFSRNESGMMPNVLCCSAIENKGIEAVWEDICTFIENVKKSGYFDRNRNRQNKYQMYETINSKLLNDFYTNPKMAALLLEMEEKILNNRVSAYVAADELLEIYGKDKKERIDNQSE